MSIVRICAKLRHRLPVRRHGRQRRCARVSLRESVVTRRDREAGRHPLHVVLERPRKGLVEIVQIEQQLPLRRGEHAEIRQMRIAAQLDAQPRRRRVLEVRGHDLRRTPVERERRNHHPAMPHGHEVGLAGGVLLLEQRNRVGAVPGRTPAPVTRRGRSAPGLLTLCFPLVGAEMHDPFRRRHRPSSGSSRVMVQASARRGLRRHPHRMNVRVELRGPSPQPGDAVTHS